MSQTWGSKAGRSKGRSGVRDRDRPGAVCMTMKMAHGLGWGPLVLPPLSEETRVGYATCVAVVEGRGKGELGRWDSRVEWESGEVSRPIGQLDEGERKGWQGGR